MGRLVGIDLGTTNSCVAVLEGGKPQVIPTRHGDRTLPSMVAFREDGQRLVGTVAKRQAAVNPTRTVFGAKRLIGRKRDDPRIVEWSQVVGYALTAAPNGDAWILIDGKQYTPQEMSARVLAEVKANAEEHLGEEVDGAVVTVPAHFDDSQRQATKDAGAIAGLDIQKIINEPTAAALAYGIDKQREETFAVFDLGGGTFDITILRTEDGVFEILSTNGDTFLGGDDFDHALIQHLVDEFQQEHSIDLTKEPQALQRLREASETAKRELSSAPNTAINLPFLAAGANGAVHLERDPVERQLLNRLCRPLLDRLEDPCLTALSDAGLGPEDLDRVILVGGMTRMQAVQRVVEQIFGKAPSRDINPDEIVALGAATQCGILSGEIDDAILLDVTPHSLGVKVRGGRMSVLIPKNTTVPTSEKKVFRTTQDQQGWVDIEVYQGEADLAGENTHVGRFTLADLPSAKAGAVQVEVTFLIDADGVINATARELLSGQNTSVRIKLASGLTDQELKQLMQQK